jgi:hypothetical protein
VESAPSWQYWLERCADLRSRSGISGDRISDRLVDSRIHQLMPQTWRSWTTRELAVVRRYPQWSVERIKTELPHRTKNAISIRITLLGLARLNEKIFKKSVRKRR